MTIPNLPPQGSTAWYAWATALDVEARKVAAKIDGVNGTVAGQVPVWDTVDGRYEPATLVDVTATDVPFTPTGTIAATNVQTALVELDTEKSATGHTHAASGIVVQDENANVATAVTQIDFQGAGVTTTAGTGEVIVTIPGGGSGGTITTQDEGVSLSTAVTTLNFTGAGVTASGAVGTTTVNIPGVSSGSSYLAYATLAAGSTTVGTVSTDLTGGLAVTFTAPASGAVLVRAQALVSTASSNDVNFQVRNNADGVVVSSRRVFGSGVAHSTELARPEFIITGLTAGTSYTWKLSAIKVGAGTVSVFHSDANDSAVLLVQAL